MPTRRAVLGHVLTIAGAGALACLLPHAASAEAARALKWTDLVPPRGPSPLKPRTFFSGSARIGDDARPGDETPPPPPLREGQFMSMKRYQPGGDEPPRVVEALNGQRVSIGGYVVPLDFEATRITDFLLVPFVGACIHVPPPPANQIVYVKIAQGVEIRGAFDPVSVTGTLRTATAVTGLADAGYTLEAEDVTIIEE